jgi:hypothetical protein
VTEKTPATKGLQRMRGLVRLLGDVVQHGATAIEKVHLATAQRPFAILEHIPGLAEPTQLVHAIHDVCVISTYAAIRMVTNGVVLVADLAVTQTSRAPPNADGSAQPSEGIGVPNPAQFDPCHQGQREEITDK